MSVIHLLPEGGDFYKANLHCHSTISDGRRTPQELKDAYKAHGYSVLCITDHELLIDHSDLNDEDFLTLTGYEISVDAPGNDWQHKKVCHINLYSPRPDYTKYVCFPADPGAYYNAHMKESLREEDIPEERFEREYTPECISEIARIAHETGFLCSYNHPSWSLETAKEYCGYKGYDMMEIVNFGCTIDGFDEHNGHAYDEMLRAGRRLACSATDDNHNVHPWDDPMCDSFGGWVWLKLPALTYENVFEALRYGDFYACAGGPTISELTLDTEKRQIRLVCSGAREIHLNNAGRATTCRRACPGELLTEQVFDLNGTEGYVRFDLTGPDGLRTYTRAYFLDEYDCR